MLSRAYVALLRIVKLSRVASPSVQNTPTVSDGNTMKSQSQIILDAARRGKVAGRQSLKKRQTKRRAGKLRHGRHHDSDTAVISPALSDPCLGYLSAAPLDQVEQECPALLISQPAIDEANEPGAPDEAGERPLADIERGDEADLLLAPERQRNAGSVIDAVSETPGAAAGS
jgi:hypothetical protein